MKIGLIGLGKMGFNLALNMKEHGYSVVGFDRDGRKVTELEANNLTGAGGIQELVDKLEKRRIVWLMVPAGMIIDQVIEELMNFLSPGDIVIDGGNSHYKDTLRRYTLLKEKGIDFADIGTSGGMEGARKGICAMVGAEESTFRYIEPLIRDISVPNGYLYTGKNGSGHFTKMVHNGIEYGIMQAIGEGFEVLEKSEFDLNLQQIARLWNHGSVIRGWLMELAEQAFQKDPDLVTIRGIMRSSGEGLWTVQEALALKVPVPTIAAALFMRYRSEQEDAFSGKVVAALRNEFGGHQVEKTFGTAN
ncbi:MAG TPA: decarboxylating 6-phosphogluconate dehydrogenase [Bacillota bacterium]|nr:decarboxylating 6-phosphogluconate dehydrogenase [Bacillota bacterium]